MKNRINDILEGFGSAVLLAWRAFASLPKAPRILKRIAEHGYYSGYSTLPIASILCFFIGAELAAFSCELSENKGTFYSPVFQLILFSLPIFVIGGWLLLIHSRATRRDGTV